MVLKTRRCLTVLGATGSIGASTLDVVARHRDRFEVFALTAHHNADKLVALCRIHRPRFAVLSTSDEPAGLREALRAASPETELLVGLQALCAVAEDAAVDDVMAAVVGGAGLPPTWAAVRAGKRVLLANKESLVMGGALVVEEARRSGASIVPIDSEHNAIFQSLPQGYCRQAQDPGIRRIILTASGGPFRQASAERLARVTPEEACAHPNWVMGRKISVDSATMMNKGLEVIEAHWLFGLPAERIRVLVHPQSVIHSMVEYIDGSVIAQLGNPDMRTPIAHALAYPERIEAGVASLDLAAIGALNFEEPDHARFPCLGLAFDALRAGGSAPIVVNAANEVAVAAFLDHRLSFSGIAEVIREVLEATPIEAVASLEAVFAADDDARSRTRAVIARHPGAK